MQLTDVLAQVAHEAVRRRVEKRAGIMLPLAVGAMIPGIAHKAIERAHNTEHDMNAAINQPFKTAALPPWLAMPMAQFAQSPGKAMKGLGSAAAGAVGRGASSAGHQMFGNAGKDDKPSGFMGSLGSLGEAPIKGIAGGVSGGITKLLERGILGREFGEKKDPFHMSAGAAVSSFGKEMGTSGANLLRDIANKAMEAAGHAGDASAREAIIGDLKRTDPVLSGADDATLMEAYHTMSRFAPVLSTDKNAVRSFLRQAVTSGSGPDFMSIKLVADAERAVTGDKKASLDLHALLQAAAKPALAGAAVGGISGAMADGDDRSGGALRGALTGGALGGLGGAVHGHMTGPKPPTMSTPPVSTERNPAEEMFHDQGRVVDFQGLDPSQRRIWTHQDIENEHRFDALMKGR